MITILITRLTSTGNLTESRVIFGLGLLKMAFPLALVFFCKLIELVAKTATYRTWSHFSKAGFDPDQCNNRVRSIYKSFFIQ